MTKHEAAVIGAYTGILLGDFEDLHKYIEITLARSVYSHELATDELSVEIKEKSKEDFLAICAEITE